VRKTRKTKAERRFGWMFADGLRSNANAASAITHRQRSGFRSGCQPA
jgi:hypothetical protein